MSTLDAIQQQVTELAKRIGAPAEDLPTYGRSEQSGLPHVEVTSDGLMHWVVCERGKEYERNSTLDRNELLYWVFQSVTFSMAMMWERDPRVQEEDFRKLLWIKQFQLLDELDPTWTERRKKELGTLLHYADL